MMNRRRFLEVALPTLGLACVGCGPALAETLEEKVVKALRRQGYREIKTGRTFLGRLRVTAEKGEKRREVILNRQTGEVLRDVILGRRGGGSVFGDENDSDTDGTSEVDDDGRDDRDDDKGDDGGKGESDHDSGGSNGGDDGGSDD